MSPSKRSMERILITGATGQIGSELTGALRERYGKDNVVAAGHRGNSGGELEDPFERIEVLDEGSIARVIERYEIDSLFHLAAILSARGEENPQLAFEVNLIGSYKVLELGLEYDLRRILIPSSIGVFGPETPKENTPNETVLRPTSIYGVTKVAAELLGDYYFRRFGLDVRGLRLPGIVSHKTLPGGGTTDYAVEAFYGALQEGHYDFFVREDTVLPMMYMPDCIRALIELAEADLERLDHHSDFNVSGASFSAGQLAREIGKHVDDFTYRFQPDERQRIADSWPNSLDDTAAGEEWGWEARYGLEEMAADMIEKLRLKIS